MPIEVFANDSATGTLATGGITNVATTLTLTAGHGARFPTIASGSQFRVRVDDEIMIVTLHGASSDTMTVTRGQEGTTAVAHSAGADVHAVLTAGAIENTRDYTSIHLDDFGADPTGATDASAAINAAINSQAAGVRIKITARYGATYRCDNPVIINRDNVIFDGNYAKLVRGGTNTVLSITGTHATTTTTYKLVRCRVSNLVLDGNGATGGAASPVLKLYYAAECFFDKVLVSNAISVGFQAVEAWDTFFYDFRCIDCHGDGNAKPSALFMSEETVGRTTLTAQYTSPGTTITVRDTSGFPSSGTVWINSITSFSYTGKTATTFTGVTGGFGQHNAGAVVVGSAQSTGAGHSVDNTNNLWFYGVNIETWKDGGLWVEGAENNRAEGISNKIRIYGGKIETLAVRNYANAVRATKSNDIQFFGINTTIGAFDSGIPSAQPANHCSFINATAVSFFGYYGESSAAGSTEGFLRFDYSSNIVLMAPLFAGATGSPTSGAILWNSTSAVQMVGENYVSNPASMPLHVGQPTNVNTPELQTVAGVVSDASFARPPLVGAVAIDTTNLRFYGKIAASTFLATSFEMSGSVAYTGANIAWHAYSPTQTITMTGAAVGDRVEVSFTNATNQATIKPFGWVSAANTVSVHLRNQAAATGNVNPGSGTIKAVLSKQY
jgi:hypothetical protein